MKVISLQTMAIKRVLEQEGRHTSHPFDLNNPSLEKQSSKISLHIHWPTNIILQMVKTE